MLPLIYLFNEIFKKISTIQDVHLSEKSNVQGEWLSKPN